MRRATLEKEDAVRQLGLQAPQYQAPPTGQYQAPTKPRPSASNEPVSHPLSRSFCALSQRMCRSTYESDS